MGAVFILRDIFNATSRMLALVKFIGHHMRLKQSSFALVSFPMSIRNLSFSQNENTNNEWVKSLRRCSRSKIVMMASARLRLPRYFMYQSRDLRALLLKSGFILWKLYNACRKNVR